MAIKCSTETTITNQIDATDLIMWYYATTLTTKPLSPSTTSASATPTGWSLIEPTITSASDLSKYIYECLQIVWGDGTCSWGDVQLSASFEAAKQAYNLAHSTASIFTTFEQTHNKTLVDTVNESSSAITTLTESHQYGGINLLSNTKSIDSSSAPYTNSNIRLYSNQAPIDGESFYYCSGPKYFQIDFPTLINNQKYTLSFDISRSSDSRPVFVKINEIETNIGTAAATTWTRLSHTFTANASTTNVQIRVAFNSTSSTATYIAAIRHIKLEQGSLATPWEYSSNDISTLSNTVNTVSQTADSNSSTISNLTQTLGTNANGTTKTDDIVHQVSDINQDLNGITTRVGKTEIALKGNYAVSSTAKGTANKQATISPALANYELVKGAAITVKFTTENTAANPTLNINSTGAKPIKNYSGAALSENEYKWNAGSTMTFVYDGTNWCIQDSTELTRIKNNETLINQTANNVLIKATESDTTAAQGGQHLIQSLINVAPNGIKISADKVDIEGAAIFSENGYLSQDNINAINNESQTIYIQAVSGTSSVSGTTTWVTNTGESVTQDAANLTPVWTIKRPIYRTNYPVLFVATQYKTIDGTVTCTTPLKDDTITVIDAGHITTGTIDASNITVTNLNADNITTGTINGQRIGVGSLSLDKLAEDVYTKNETDGLISTEVSNRNSAIEQSASAINLSVSQTYTTKTEFNNLEIGGRNFVLRSGDFYEWYKSIPDEVTFVNEDGGTYANLNPSSVSWLNIQCSTHRPIALLNGKTITISCDVRGHNVPSSMVSNCLYLNIQGYASKTAYNRVCTIDMPYSSSMLKENEWVRISRTLAFDDDARKSFLIFSSGQTYESVTHFDLALYNHGGFSIDYRHPQIEYGNKTTDWTPAPEDIDSDISAIESRVTTAETSITQNKNDIALRAKSSDVYTKTQVDGKITQEVTDRNSAIEQSASAINLNVSQTYTTKTEFNNLEIGGRGTWYADWPRPVTTVELGYLSEKKYIEEAGFVQDFSKKFCMRVDFMRSSSYQTERYCLASPYGLINADTSHSYPELGIELQQNTGRLHIYSTSDTNGPFDSVVGTAPELDIWSTALVWWDPETKEITWLLVSGDRSETGHYTPSGTYSRKSGLIRLGADSRVNSTWNVKYYQRDMPPIWYEEPPEDPKNLCRWSLIETPEGTPKNTSPVECSSGNASIEAAKAAIKVTTDGISSTVEKISSAKYLVSTSGGSTLANIKTWSAEGYSGAWTVASGTTTNLRNGDVVYLKYRDNTRDCFVYIKGIVTAFTNYNVTMTSHGYEDILPVDTIKSTINQSSDSVKIQANHIEIDGATVFSNSDFRSAADAAYDAKGAAATAESNAKSYADDTESRIISRGEQLVINGNGFMGDNTNFTNFTFDTSISNNSPGSFTRAVGQTTVYTDEMFPVDTSKEYIAEFDVKSGPNGAAMHAMLVFLDVDKRVINVQSVSYIDGSTTTLARELKNGDTKVYLTSVAGFNKGVTENYKKALIFWNYTNSYGYTYPPETYSKKYYIDLWADSSSFDTTNNTITLKKAWSNGTFPAGTSVSQNTSGSNYAYFWSMTNKTLFPTTWTRVSGTYSGVKSSGEPNAGTVFWPGTAYCKIGWLWNHGASSTNVQDQIWITNVSVKEYVASSSDAVKRTQRIYWRSTSNTKPSPYTTWLSTSGDGYGNWSLNVPQLTKGTTKYPFLYTAVQSQTVSQQAVGSTCTCSTVMIDDSTTVIDGGNIITGTVTANKLNAANINASKTLTVGAMTDAAASTILNSNVQIGGRNLLLETGAAKTCPAISLNSKNYAVYDYYALCRPYHNLFSEGDLLTLSFDWSCTSTSGNFHIEAGAGSPYILGMVVSAEGTRSTASNYVNVASTNTSGHVVVTFKATSATVATGNDYKWFCIRTDGTGWSGKTLTVSNAKIERGSKATDWTPAPEDVDADISAAAKTATNYITRIDDNGITVHPSGGTASRVQINASGTTIYQNNVDVASYGASARIGKADGDRVVVDSTDGITIYKGNSKRLQTTANGVDVYGSDGTTSIASFGSTTRIGTASAQRVSVGSNNVDIYDSNNKLRTRVNSDGLTTYGPNGSTVVHQLSSFTSDASNIYAYSSKVKVLNNNVTLIAAPYADGFDVALSNGANGWDANYDTHSHTTSVLSARRWSSTANKYDTAELQVNVFSGGELPAASLLVGSGDGDFAGISMTASESSSEVNLQGTTLKINGTNIALGPTTLTLNSATKAYTSGMTPKYRKWGNVVNVYGAVSPKSQVAAEGTLAIGTLPSGYRPSLDSVWLCQGSGTAVWMLQINANGTMTASRYRTGTTYAAMPDSAWLIFNVTFIVS